MRLRDGQSGSDPLPSKFHFASIVIAWQSALTMDATPERSACSEELIRSKLPLRTTGYSLLYDGPGSV